MDAPRKGCQTPTTSFTLPYSQTCGQEAVDLYNTTGRAAQEWQELLACDILASNADGLWVHTKYGYAVPRRNGKNEIVAIREMWGLQNGENILHPLTALLSATPHGSGFARCWIRRKLHTGPSRQPGAKASGWKMETGGSNSAPGRRRAALVRGSIFLLLTRRRSTPTTRKAP